MDRDKVIKLLIDHRRDLHAVFACLSKQNIVDAAYLLGRMIEKLESLEGRIKNEPRQSD